MAGGPARRRKQARLSILVTALATVVSLVLVSRLSLSRDLTDLFPRTAEAEALARVTRVFGGGDVALVLLEGADAAEVERAAADAGRALRDEGRHGAIERVVEAPPGASDLAARDPTSAWRWASPIARRELARIVSSEGAMRERLRETRALLLAPGSTEVSDLLERDPLRLSQVPFESRVELAAGASARPGTPFVANEGRARLLVVVPRGHALESTAAARFTADAERALGVARRAHPSVTIALAGGHVIAQQTEAMMRSDLTKSSALSLVLASVVFVLTFRRARALVAVLPPLAAGTLWTTAIAALAFPRLSAIAIAFMAVVVGVGVDTGVHVYGHLLAARREGLSPREAADRARRETLRPTLGAAVAAGLAFGCLALSDIAGMRQLGLLCAAGEVLTAIAILVVVPEVGAWLERGPPPKPVRMGGVAAITATRPRAFVALSLAFAAMAGALAIGAPRLEHGVVALDAKTLPVLGTYEKIYATFGGTKGQLVAVSADPDPERARARADAIAEAASTLLARHVIVGYDALAEVAPSIATQRARLADRDALDLPSRAATLRRALEDEGFAVGAFAAALDAFAHPSSDASDAPADETLDWVKRRHLGQDARGTIAVTYVRLTGSPAEDAEARTTLRAADPEVVLTGYADLEASLRDTLTRDLPRVLVSALGMVLVVLAFSLRDVRAVALAVVVLLVEIALVLLSTRALGVRWHVYDALVLPVLLGVTLDEVLFLLAAAGRVPLEDALAEQAPLGSATALTTAAGFGALAICRFRGLVDLGLVGALGSTIGLWCALVLVPAGLRVVRRRSHAEP
jgi:hypothetical protein